ncbi:MAG TPA: M23 family metallopeptidase [Dermatophilaceae bacterium]|nr:M23 family metallopeptidase [Dermatophilaceae bacterium]
MSFFRTGRHRAPARRAPLTPGAGLALPTAVAVVLTLTGGAAVVATARQAGARPTTAAAAAWVTPAGAERAYQAGPAVAGQPSDQAVERAAARDAAAARAADRSSRAARARSDLAVRQLAAELAAARRWVLPLKGYTLSSRFGLRWGRLHAGNDFAVPVGTRLGAMSTGTVIFAGEQSGYGTKVEIRYWDGTVSYFAHMSRLAVKRGDRVHPGQLVGLSGNSGHSTGPHLHLEIHPGGGKPVDPLPWLRAHGIRVNR